MSSIESPEPSRNFIQRVSDKSHGVLTLPNALDVIAFAGVIKYAPELDTRTGIAAVGASFTADMIDGPWARFLDTTSEFSGLMDHLLGDKPKIAKTVYHIAKKNLAPKKVLGMVIAQQGLNAAATGYDIFKNGKNNRQVTLSVEGQHAMFGEVLGTSLHVMAKEAERSEKPRLAQALSTTGTIMVTGATFYPGLRSAHQYWSQASGRNLDHYAGDSQGRAPAGKMLRDAAGSMILGAAIYYGGQTLSGSFETSEIPVPHYKESDLEAYRD